MLKIKNPGVLPPHDLEYQTAPGFCFKDRSLKNLTKKTRDWYLANNVPIPIDLPRLVEEANCHLYPEICGDVERGGHTDVAKSVDLGSALDFTAMLAKMVEVKLHGEDGFVSQAEAERRASICVVCPQNVPVAGCNSCGATSKVVNALLWLSGKKTSLDSQLKGCASCGCLLKAKVYIRKDVMAKTPLKEAYHVDCWMLEGAPSESGVVPPNATEAPFNIAALDPAFVDGDLARITVHHFDAETIERITFQLGSDIVPDPLLEPVTEVEKPMANPPELQKVELLDQLEEIGKARPSVNLGSDSVEIPDAGLQEPIVEGSLLKGDIPLEVIEAHDIGLKSLDTKQKRKKSK